MNQEAIGHTVITLLIAMMSNFLIAGHVSAKQSEKNSLHDIRVVPLVGNKVKVDLMFTHPVIKPSSFSMNKPARIVFDFAKVDTDLEKQTKLIDSGYLKSVTAVQTQQRSRVIFNLVALVGYKVEQQDKRFSIILDSGQALKKVSKKTQIKKTRLRKVEKIDFRRDYTGAGKILFTLSDPGISVDIKEQAGKIHLAFAGARLLSQRPYRMDVIDFGTPVQYIDSYNRQSKVDVTIRMAGDYDHLVYQTDRLLTVEVRPLTPIERDKRKSEKFAYSGDRLSLNFQDIEVRAVLQLIADFTGLNMVASDTVQGNVTLRLQNVPWDQALDIILKSKGLDKRQVGNVLMVAPSQEIAAREKLELESSQQVKELAPLRSEFMQINYAKASDVAALLKNEANSLLSARGNISVDERTNTLLVQDTLLKLQEIREIITRIDTPVRQVEIEARVVTATDNFKKELGIRWGGLGSATVGAYKIGGAGGIADSQIQADPTAGTLSPIASRLNVDLGVAAGSNPGTLALSLARLGKDTLLDLELTAAESDELANVIASPRLITSNQKEAVIKQGKEIPYLEASSSGATSVSFKEAVLELRVTPQITPDDRIIMDLNVKQDVTLATTVTQTSLPVIDTKEIETQVLVENGETIVLGGIYERNKNKTTRRVPFFGDMPFVGRLFRNSADTDDRSELLIFVTPRIVHQQLTVR